ncbi:MAG: hypothetical protein FJX23_09440 [Alphaproteobacteria bacterium]|nr:hypothetical protein [Alphaproteobacteria bacterium]
METLAWLGVIAVLVVAYLVSIFLRQSLKEHRERKAEENKKKAAEEAAFLKRLAPVLADIMRLPVGQFTFQPPPVPKYIGIWIFELPPRQTITPAAHFVEKAVYLYLRAVEAGKVEKQLFKTQSALVAFVDNHIKRLL